MNGGSHWGPPTACPSGPMRARRTPPLNARAVRGCPPDPPATPPCFSGAELRVLAAVSAARCTYALKSTVEQLTPRCTVATRSPARAGRVHSACARPLPPHARTSLLVGAALIASAGDAAGVPIAARTATECECSARARAVGPVGWGKHTPCPSMGWGP